MASRIRDTLGRLSLAVWLVMVALVIFASAVIPDWPPPDTPHGAAPPSPPHGCLREVNAVMSTSRYVCRGTPADALIGGALNYARDWVGSILVLPLFVLAPALLLSPLFWLTSLPSALSLGLAADFVRRRLVRRRATRLATRTAAPARGAPPARSQTPN